MTSESKTIGDDTGVQAARLAQSKAQGNLDNLLVSTSIGNKSGELGKAETIGSLWNKFESDTKYGLTKPTQEQVHKALGVEETEEHRAS